MKRLFVIFSLLAFLSVNTAFGELLKLPILIRHYLVHKNLEKKGSFVTFLKDHYTNTAQHGNYTHHCHDNLPFKTIDNHLSQLNYYFPLNAIKIERKELLINNINVVVNYSANFSNHYLNKIWQPPKFC